MAKLVQGSNDFASIHPELVPEWHPQKNGSLAPGDITYGSTLSVWWLGKCGHEWEMKVYYRSQGRGCPICNRNTSTACGNDLLSVSPGLAKEWDKEKNGILTPSDVRPKSNRKVWWQCPVCQHKWIASVANRQSGTGCPRCAKKKWVHMIQKTRKHLSNVQSKNEERGLRGELDTPAVSFPENW